MTQSETRMMFTRANPGVRRPGYGGYWYKCEHCGQWCGRPGREKAYIPEHMKMEVDHRIPKYRGGTDDLSNLQPLCRTCNRSKGANVTGMDVAGTVIRSAVNGTLGNTITSAVKQNLKNALGFKYKRE